MAKKKRKIKLGKHIFEALDIPEESYLDSAKITLWGKETVLIEKHEGIFECAENKVRLFTKHGLLHVEGEKLVLLEMSDERLYITGKVEQIGYEA